MAVESGRQQYVHLRAHPPPLGKIRRLTRIADENGFFRVGAIDHPPNYAARFSADLSTVSHQEVARSKAAIVPALADTATVQVDKISDLAAACSELEISLIVEPIWYGLDGEDVNDPAVQRARFAETVRSAARFAAAGADVLKVEFPGCTADTDSLAEAETFCAALDAGLSVPWVLLSAGVAFEEFATQLRIAAQAGASGFMAGRSVRGDAVGRLSEEHLAAGIAIAEQRMDILGQIVTECGRPWRMAPTLDETLTVLDADWAYRYRA